MDEKEIKENTQILSNICNEVYNLIEKYNLIAKELDYNTRLALVTAECNREKEVLANYKSLHDYVNKTDEAWCGISAPGDASGWVPSQMGC